MVRRILQALAQPGRLRIHRQSRITTRPAIRHGNAIPMRLLRRPLNPGQGPPPVRFRLAIQVQRRILRVPVLRILLRRLLPEWHLFPAPLARFSMPKERASLEDRVRRTVPIIRLAITIWEQAQQHRFRRTFAPLVPAALSFPGRCRREHRWSPAFCITTLLAATIMSEELQILPVP